jgi:hypothetical protein
MPYYLWDGISLFVYLEGREATFALERLFTDEMMTGVRHRIISKIGTHYLYISYLGLR